jgi:hypothetical protein
MNNPGYADSSLLNLAYDFDISEYFPKVPLQVVSLNYFANSEMLTLYLIEKS